VERLARRPDMVLKTIVGQYIVRATPVPSQNLISDGRLEVSSATVRNDMAFLEHEGYIIRPHISSGSVPTDKGYRYYVESLTDINLPLTEKRYISHIFHQVEKELDDWLRLAATLLSQQVKNMAVVTVPKASVCRFRMVEAVVIAGDMARVVLILQGARVKQRLLSFNDIKLLQSDLNIATHRLSELYEGKSRAEIEAGNTDLNPLEEQLASSIADIMKVEDEQSYEEPYLDGMHIMLGQPEFSQGQRLQSLMELIEHRRLVRAIVPPDFPDCLDMGVKVIIGGENMAEGIHDYSVVIGRYGCDDELSGTVSIIGPTRMAYGRAISAVSYLTSILTELVDDLYGRTGAAKE
jgi:heat-inducible transcriptional repressor